MPHPALRPAAAAHHVARTRPRVRLRGWARACAGVLFAACSPSVGTPDVGTRTAPAPTAPDTARGAASTPPTAMTPIPAADRLLAAYHSGYEEPAQLVLRDRAAWEAAWRRVGAGEGAPPAIDFTRDVVVLVAMGTRPTGGYEARLDGVSTEGGATIVHATFVSPGPSCMTGQALSAPVAAARIRRPAGDVRFAVRELRQDC